MNSIGMPTFWLPVKRYAGPIPEPEEVERRTRIMCQFRDCQHLARFMEAA